MSTSPPHDRPAAADAPRGALLHRVRSLFRLLAWLLLLVEGIEWLDATSALWPNRTIAAVALLAAFAWTIAIDRAERPAWWLDAGIVAALVVAGWGLGRPGAVISLLLGTTLIRGLYGRRGPALVGTSALMAGYALIGVLLDGPGALLDLGLLTVVVALGSFALVTRLLGELIAQHDLERAWDVVLSDLVVEMAAVTDGNEIETRVARILGELEEVGPSASSGMVEPPHIDDFAPLRRLDGAIGHGGLGAELESRLDRLAACVRLARERVDSESRYRQLADGSRDGIYLRAMGERNELVYANDAAVRLLERIATGAGPPFHVDAEMIHEDDRDSIEVVIAEHGFLRDPVRVRLPAPDQPEGERWVEIQELIYQAGDEGEELIQGTIHDVSRLRRHEAALEMALSRERDASEGLRHLDELRATFLAAVSHELRTPLAALVGSSQTLAFHRSRLTEEQSSDLAAAVTRQGARLQGLLDDLLDVERLSQGLIVPERTPTRLLGLVRQVSASQSDEGLVVEVDPASDDVVLDVDAAQVERIVDNLIRNAMKHTPEGTRIRTVVRADPRGALLVVEDDGPGVPADLRKALFEPFVQGPSPALASSPGTGIGLSLVNRFAELHGGRAWVEESEGGGARFVVLLSGQPTEAERRRHAGEDVSLV